MALVYMCGTYLPQRQVRVLSQTEIHHRHMFLSQTRQLPCTHPNCGLDQPCGQPAGGLHMGLAIGLHYVFVRSTCAELSSEIWPQKGGPRQSCVQVCTDNSHEHTKGNLLTHLVYSLCSAPKRAGCICTSRQCKRGCQDCRDQPEVELSHSSDS